MVNKNIVVFQAECEMAILVWELKKDNVKTISAGVVPANEMHLVFETVVID